MNDIQKDPVRIFAICQICGKKESYPNTPNPVNSCAGCGTEKARMTCTSDPEEADQIVDFIKTYSTFYTKKSSSEANAKADLGRSRLSNRKSRYRA